ncbi:MAG: hypothetical protein JJU36_18070 [Phycisphaeraceae bacterium]|nr:hypothetical protein [Phycisphaeraceae bacterium]
MNRVQMTGIFLTASALVLGLMVVVKLADVNPAQARMVTSGNSFEYLTAMTQPGSDSLFILDRENHVLIVYQLQLRGNRGTLEPLETLDLRRVMGFQQDRQRPGARQPGGGGVPR